MIRRRSAALRAKPAAPAVLAAILLGTACLFVTSRPRAAVGQGVGDEEERSPASPADAGQGNPSWIWYDEGDPLREAPAATRYFRRVVDLPRPSDAATIDITCDNAYTLYFNGDEVGRGEDWRRVRNFDVSDRVLTGRNVIAVEASNSEGPAALLVRFSVLQTGGTTVTTLSDGSWIASAEAAEGWNAIAFDDSGWSRVHVLGEYGRVGPWAGLTWESDFGEQRFQAPEGFRVDRIASPEITGSIVAMTFDEQGRVVATREGGPIIRLTDEDGNGVAERADVIADQVNNCQGVFFYDGMLYLVGRGPEGTGPSGLFRLHDGDGDGFYEELEHLAPFDRPMGEHGPHAVLLGPDGYLYVVCGNHSHVAVEVEPDSPHDRFYEGDILQPRYEDARGHAVGVTAPGGTMFRIDPAGEHWWRVAGGFRNQYDIAFSAAGEMFTFDSDMEWDIGLPWHRPVRVCHVPPGAEFGWRSGSAKWPAYYFDSLPACVDIGRGSPTGVVFYHHRQFPTEYHDAFFICDWSQGKILAIHLTRDGATWIGEAEEFLTGNPLNVTDIEVAPDGSLVFSCGGRGTEGGIFRISHTNPPPDPYANVRLTPVGAAVRQPQPEAAWSRARFHELRAAAGQRWGWELEEIAGDPNVETQLRHQALVLLQQFGPPPSEELLVRLTEDADPLIRADAVWLLGIHASEAGHAAVVAALGDDDALVRRRACEALIESGMPPRFRELRALLADHDRFVRFAARDVLERVPSDEWEAPPAAGSGLAGDAVRIANASALARLILGADDAQLRGTLTFARGVLESSEELPADDVLDTLRIVELAALQAELLGSDRYPELRDRLLEMFPTGDWRINREIARLLSYFRDPRAVEPLCELLASEIPREERLHLAHCLRYFEEGWTTERKLQLLAFYSEAHGYPGGFSFAGYMENFCRDFLPVLTEEERGLVLDQGERMPLAARLLVASLGPERAAQLVPRLIALDRRLQETQAGDPHDQQQRNQVATEVLMALGRGAAGASPAQQEARAYLLSVFETTPDRREAVARALAQHPAPESFPILVQTLRFGERQTLIACLQALMQLDMRPEEPDDVRALIIAGLRLREEAGPAAVELLGRWVGEQMAHAGDDLETALARWQEWFAATYPDLPPAELPRSETEQRYTYEQLLAFLTENPAGRTGSAERGYAIFEQAQCTRCHLYGQRGEGLGPDLTTIRARFQRKEILEAILFPSQIISDQYRSVTLVTVDGQVRNGMAAPQDDMIVLLLSDGTRETYHEDDIEEMVPSNVSVMPEGLLNELTLEQIADLFAYMESPPEQVAAEGGGGGQ